MKNLKIFAVPAIALFLICLIATALLGVTNRVTAPMIDELAQQTELETRQIVLPTAADFSEEKSVPGSDNTYVEGIKDGKTVGYVFVTVTKGYGGDVKIMTGVDTEGKVTGVYPLELNETAGLGMNAKKDSFLDQFLRKTNGIKVSKSGASGNEIQALTGATITSNAVTGAVNEALGYYKAIKEAE